MHYFDFLVRNQAAIFSAASALVLAATVFQFLRRQWLAEEAEDTVTFGMPAKSDILGDVIMPFFRSRSGSLLLLTAVLLVVLAFARPVPKTAGLDLGDEKAFHRGSNGKLIVLIHGWRGDGTGTWKRFPELMRTDPELAEYNQLIVDYPTFLVRRNLRITEMAKWLLESIRSDSQNASYQEVLIIAHSMGGVLAREIVIQNRLQGKQILFGTIVSIASPLSGTKRAKLASTLGISAELTRDLTPDSGFIVGLQQHWNELRPRPYTYCITSPHDKTVSQASATTQCDEIFRYPQWDHTEMVKPSNHSDPRYWTPVRALRASHVVASGEPSDRADG